VHCTYLVTQTQSIFRSEIAVFMRFCRSLYPGRLTE
jgi:hypothetical protein